MLPKYSSWPFLYLALCQLYLMCVSTQFPQPEAWDKVSRSTSAAADPSPCTSTAWWEEPKTAKRHEPIRILCKKQPHFILILPWPLFPSTHFTFLSPTLQENRYRCTVTIGRLVPNTSWLFPSCNKCSKSCVPDGTGYRCIPCSNTSFKFK